MLQKRNIKDSYKVMQLRLFTNTIYRKTRIYWVEFSFFLQQPKINNERYNARFIVEGHKDKDKDLTTLIYKGNRTEF